MGISRGLSNAYAGRRTSSRVMFFTLCGSSFSRQPFRHLAMDSEYGIHAAPSKQNVFLAESSATIKGLAVDDASSWFTRYERRADASHIWIARLACCRLFGLAGRRLGGIERPLVERVVRRVQITLHFEISTY